MLQERGDLLHRQLLNGQLAGIGFLTRHKLQHQLEAVPVTEDGMRTHRPLLRQVIRKEPPQRGGQGSDWNFLSPDTSASKN